MKLSQIVKIESLNPIPDADRIERARVLGWDCVVQKGLYQVRDFVLFVFPDTLIPKRFLDPSYEGEDKVRLKTVKMRGQYSAGLLIPLDEVKKYLPKDKEFAEGDDLSEFLGIEKYEKPMPANLGGQALGGFPSFFVAKTDEDNYRSNPSTIEEMKALGDEEVVVTTKMDGSSMTCLVYPIDNEFKVCSRNLMWKEDDKNTFWKAAKDFKIEEALRSYPRKLAFQAEVCGPGINGNNLALPNIQPFMFLMYDLDKNQWLTWDEAKSFCEEHNIPTVTELKRLKAKDLDFAELQEMADNLKYPSNKPAEGLVVRPVKPIISETLKKFWISLKVISQPYARKYD